MPDTIDSGETVDVDSGHTRYGGALNLDGQLNLQGQQNLTSTTEDILTAAGNAEAVGTALADTMTDNIASGETVDVDSGHTRYGGALNVDGQLNLQGQQNLTSTTEDILTAAGQAEAVGTATVTAVALADTLARRTEFTVQGAGVVE